MSVKNFPKRLDSKTSCLRITVPENLDLALEGLIRKVLKEQPKTDDIHSFAADYFEKLLKIRDKAGGTKISPQLCPFHNDEDANEMIKLASTFNPPMKNTKPLRSDDSKRGKETESKRQTKGMKKAKSKVTSKSEEQSGEQRKPDLVKKLSRTTSDGIKGRKKEKTQTEVEAGGSKGKGKVGMEKKEKNILDKAPIKDLIEKELKEVSEKNPKRIPSEEKQEEGKTLKEETSLNDEKEELKESVQKESETNEETEMKEKTTDVDLMKNNEKAEATEESNKTADSKPDEKIKNFEKTNSTTSEDKTAENVADESKFPEENQTKMSQSQDADVTDIQKEKPNEHPEEIQTEKIEAKTFGETLIHEKSPEAVPELSEKVTESEIYQKDEIKEMSSVGADTGTTNSEKESSSSVKEEKSENAEPKNDIPPEVDLEQAEEMSKPSLDEKLSDTSAQETNEPELQEQKEPEVTDADHTTAVDENSIITTEKAKMESAELLGNNNEYKDNSDGNQERHGLTEQAENPKASPERKPKKPEKQDEETIEDIQHTPETKELTKDETIADSGNKTNEDIVSSNVETISAAKVAEEHQTTETHSEQDELSTSKTENNEIKITDENTGKLNIEESSLNEDLKDEESKSKETAEEKSADEPTFSNESVEEAKEVKEAIKSEHKFGNEDADTSKNQENVSLTPADIQNVSEEQSEISSKQDEQTLNETTQKLENKDEEMCSVVDIQQIPESDIQKSAQQVTDNKDADVTNTIENKEQVTGNQNPNIVDATESKEMTDNKDSNETAATGIEEHEQDIVEPTEAKPEESLMEITQNKEDQTEPEEELCTVVDIQHIPQKEIERLDEDPEHHSEEQIQKKEDEDREQKAGEINDTIEDKEESKDIIETQKEETQKAEEKSGTADGSQHVIQVEESDGIDYTEKIPESSEVQIKTIQTHYYDTLQVPQTETKELKVHSVRPLSPSDVAEVSPSISITKESTSNATVSNINAFENEIPLGNIPEDVLTPMTTLKTPTELKSEPQQSAEYLQSDADQLLEAKNQLNLGSDIQRSEIEDSLDPTTPSSDYSLNLSELSWQTISGMFLDSERQYSSYEKDITKFAVSKSAELIRKSEDITKNAIEKPEIEEVFHKTVLPTDVTAVPVPPRSAEEIDTEASSQIIENSEEKINEKPKEEKSEEDKKPEENGEEKKSTDDEPDEDKSKPDNDQFENSREDSSNNEKSIDSDTPFISVEVKTVIESQILDDEEEEESQMVKVEATVEIQEEEKQKGREEAENKMSDGKESEEGPKPNQTFIEEGGGFNKAKESSSNESDSTISSAVTEIKRSDSSRRNPLLKTRSLSTFRHGVTDFEVWNTIEKELEEAATKIQSQFRSYKTRKKLQRENAVQITTEESSTSTVSAEAERQQNTGEFHDSIVLSEHPR